VTTHPACTTAWETRMGGRHMALSRRYDQSYASDFTANSAGNGTYEFNQDIGLRHRVISMKGDITQQMWETFMATIPDDGFYTWVTVYHEPDNDGGSHDGPWHRALTSAMHAAWEALGRPAHIKLYVCYTTWWANNTMAISMYPDSNIIGDFELLLDPYGETVSLLDQCTGNSGYPGGSDLVGTWRSAGGGKWGIGETGTTKTGSACATWVTTNVNLIRNEPDTNMFLYWDSQVVTPTLGTPWFLVDPQGIAAWEAQMDV
jgi:hypothetical protein